VKTSIVKQILISGSLIYQKRQGMNDPNSTKRIKTENSEAGVQNNMFADIYKKMKKKNPSLSIQSYFIASLHSIKETDMDLVNINGDEELNFVLKS